MSCERDRMSLLPYTVHPTEVILQTDAEPEEQLWKLTRGRSGVRAYGVLVTARE